MPVNPMYDLVLMLKAFNLIERFFNVQIADEKYSWIFPYNNDLGSIKKSVVRQFIYEFGHDEDMFLYCVESYLQMS
jgi:hypothetical protein